jgi:poly(3-hydroxybutyrate) depolymerase
MDMLQLLVGLILGLAGAQATSPGPAGDDELQELVVSYFQSEDADERSRLADTIADRCGGDVKAAADAVREAPLWAPLPAGTESVDVEYAPGQSTRVWVRVPLGYDATKRYPLIVALHGIGQGARAIIQYLERVLAADVDQFIIAAPQDYRGTWFLVSRAEAAEPVAIASSLRRRYHLDTDRVYVTGYSMGGHAAFMSAILYTDWFAAAVPLAGTYTTPNTPETKPTLLLNLLDFPMLLVWGARDTRDRHGHEAEGGGIAGLNRALRDELPELGVNSVEFVEIEDCGHADVVPPRERFLHYLHLRRSHEPRRVVHWFRFPEQGREGWLRQRQFSGKPWQGQMVVRVPPGGDVYEYARQTVRRKLARLEGLIEGQTIRIRVQRSKEVEILLHQGLVNLTDPITIYRGSKIVWRDVASPRISTLLELAHADWEFQRLASVRIVIPARGKARQE